MDEKTKRFELRLYFDNLTLEKDFKREKYLFIGSIVVTIFILIWALAVRSSVATTFSILTIVLSFYTLTRFAYYWFIKSKLTEEQVDNILEEDLNRVIDDSTQKLNLDALNASGLKPIYKESIRVRGLIIDEATNLPKYDIKKEKKDKTYHFATNRVIVFQITSLLIGVYICDLNSLELSKTAVIHEETFECYWKDIDSFHITKHKPFEDYKVGVFSDSKLKEIFEILDSDTDEIDIPESDSLLNNLLEQISMSEEIKEELTKLRRLINLYGKKKNFVIYEFGLRTVGGRMIGARIGKLQNVDENGRVVVDKVDEQIKAIQKEIRDMKKVGIYRDSPSFYEESGF